MSSQLYINCKKVFGTTSLYKILEIPKGTDLTLEKLHKAWKKLCCKWHSDKFATETAKIQTDARNKYNLIEEIYKSLKEKHFFVENEDNEQKNDDDSENINEIKTWKNETYYEMDLLKKNFLNLQNMLEASRETAFELEDRVKELEDEIKKSDARHKEEMSNLKCKFEMFEICYEKMERKFESLQANNNILIGSNNQYMPDNASNDHSLIEIHQDHDHFSAEHPVILQSCNVNPFVRQLRGRQVFQHESSSHKKKPKHIARKKSPEDITYSERDINYVSRDDETHSHDENENVYQPLSPTAPTSTPKNISSKKKIYDFDFLPSKGKHSKVAVLSSNDKSKCYFFHFNKNNDGTLFYRCSKCYKLKKSVTGTLRSDENGILYFMTNNDHFCAPVDYDPIESEFKLDWDKLLP